MNKELSVAERLIVAADFSPVQYGGIKGVEQRVLELSEDLKGLGVYIKVNSILRAIGYQLIIKLHHLKLKVFADLKLTDIENTLRTDAEMLDEVKPEIVTVMCNAGIDAMRIVQKVLGTSTEVLGVTVLTSLDEEECQAIYCCSTKAGVLRFARLAKAANLSGLISAPKEVEMLIKKGDLKGLTFNTPNIRPAWSIIANDDQNKNRSLTPKEAISLGAERIVIGRPILLAGPNNEGLPQSPREAVELTLKEIQQGLEERSK